MCVCVCVCVCVACDLNSEGQKYLLKQRAFLCKQHVGSVKLYETMWSFPHSLLPNIKKN
jgi:hypothetical protein